MESSDTVVSAQSVITSSAFASLVEQIVGELVQASNYAQVCYLMGQILGAKHMVHLEDLTEAQVHGIRQSLQPLLAESSFWNWAFSKPYGYAGDYVALERCYDNQVAVDSTPVGQLLDRWLLESQLACGVRERKDMLAAFIERKASAHRTLSGQPLRLLSLASGSARELRDQSHSTQENLAITLVDLDPRSLSYASDHLPKNIDARHANVLRLRPSDFSDRFDLVYSFGFFDYLKDEVIVHCLSLCRDLLASGGSIIFPLKMNSKYRYWLYDILLDWRFVKREREDGFRLANQAGLDVVELLETANESVVFYHCVPHQS